MLGTVRLLGTIRKAFIWGRSKPNISEIKSRLRILVRQLQRQKMKLDNEISAIKACAVRARKNGDMEAFRSYAEELVRFRHLALSVDKSRLYLLKILNHIQQAQTTAKTSLVMGEVGKILGILGDVTDVSRVVANVDEIARRLEEFEIERGIASTSIDSATSSIRPDEVARTMGEIEAIAGMSSDKRMSAGSEADSLEATIRALEQELDV